MGTYRNLLRVPGVVNVTASQLFARLPFCQAAKPNIQRRHRRSRQDHADADRCEQLASRRHLIPTHNYHAG